jgi:hypothetical protein
MKSLPSTFAITAFFFALWFSPKLQSGQEAPISKSGRENVTGGLIADLARRSPVGAVVAWFGQKAPPGWAICGGKDGQDKSIDEALREAGAPEEIRMRARNELRTMLGKDTLPNLDGQFLRGAKAADAVGNRQVWGLPGKLLVQNDAATKYMWVRRGEPLPGEQVARIEVLDNLNSPGAFNRLNKPDPGELRPDNVGCLWIMRIY